MGQGDEDDLDCPGSTSAFGDGLRIFGWTEEETARHFRTALQGCRERS
ncbi:MAG TPA: hypothetical protein VLF66_11100 [Thermoanaerobaculia bacterium]|nr:hypothetical protein [Thermoanaerobaculia bacterium]